MKSQSEDLQKFLHLILTKLVKYPDFIEIEKSIDDMGVFFKVRVNEMDYGRIIGNSGSIANSIRVIMRSVGNTMDARVSIRIDAPTADFRARNTSENERQPVASE